MSGGRPERFRVEVVYALREEQVLVPLEVEPGTTVGQAIERSEIPQRFPGIDLARARVGIFGKLVGLDTRLGDGDRVEIYRSLIADSKAVRRERAKRPRPAPRSA